jgi:ubiquinone/menaquinone biosynthesis C-methylase UbiE
MDQQTLTSQQFGASATHYLTSTVHATGADLDRLTALAAALHAPRILDVGSGAGHASYAVARAGAKKVVAYDLSTDMLAVVAAQAAARGHAAIETLAGPAERLPFADASFDVVVTRFSAHHWLDWRRALSEIARVLVSHGALIAIDVVAPEVPLFDTALQTLELLRDASHVRNYRGSEWRAALIEAGFAPPKIDRWKLALEFHSWVARIATSPARIDALKMVFDALPFEAREYLGVANDYSFSIEAAWIETALARPRG